MADFTLGPYETALTHAEVMVAVQVPIPGPSVRAVYAKYQVLERPAVGVAVVASVDEGWFLSPPSVVVGAVDDIPRRVPSDPLAGHPASDAEAVAEVVASAGAMVEPVDDLSGSAEFKRHVTGIMVRRLLAAVMEGQAA